MKVFLVFLVALTVSFMIFMHGIRGLHTEKVLKEGALYREVHIVWDWNKFDEWAHEHRPFRKFEQRKKQSEKAVETLGETDNEDRRSEQPKKPADRKKR